MTQATPQDTSATPFRVRLAQDVQHRIGDGMPETITAGHEVEVTEAIASMVLSWQENGQGLTAVLDKGEFQHYLDTGAIVAL